MFLCACNGAQIFIPGLDLNDSSSPTNHVSHDQSDSSQIHVANSQSAIGPNSVPSVRNKSSNGSKKSEIDVSKFLREKFSFDKNFFDELGIDEEMFFNELNLNYDLNLDDIILNRTTSEVDTTVIPESLLLNEERLDDMTSLIVTNTELPTTTTEIQTTTTTTILPISTTTARIDQTSDCQLDQSRKMPDRTVCNMYYSCENGTMHILLCPNGFLYSEIVHECEESDKVDCGQRLILAFDNSRKHSTTPVVIATTTQPKTITNDPNRSDYKPNVVNGTLECRIGFDGYFADTVF